jgi:hypothetical protein
MYGVLLVGMAATGLPSVLFALTVVSASVYAVMGLAERKAKAPAEVAEAQLVKPLASQERERLEVPRPPVAHALGSPVVLPSAARRPKSNAPIPDRPRGSTDRQYGCPPLAAEPGPGVTGGPGLRARRV